MSISSLFAKLGAALHNPRWSWGAVRASDGAVFLRVWQDRKVVNNRIPVMMITHHEKFADDSENLGYQERLKHVELIRLGAKCYMVMCVAENPSASPRNIKSFNDKEVFIGGDLCEMDGDTWVKVKERVPISDIVARIR